MAATALRTGCAGRSGSRSLAAARPSRSLHHSSTVGTVDWLAGNVPLAALQARTNHCGSRTANPPVEGAAHGAAGTGQHLLQPAVAWQPSAGTAAGDVQLGHAIQSLHAAHMAGRSQETLGARCPAQHLARRGYQDPGPTCTTTVPTHRHPVGPTATHTLASRWCVALLGAFRYPCSFSPYSFSILHSLPMTWVGVVWCRVHLAGDVMSTTRAGWHTTARLELSWGTQGEGGGRVERSWLE